MELLQCCDEDTDGDECVHALKDWTRSWQWGTDVSGGQHWLIGIHRWAFLMHCYHTVSATPWSFEGRATKLPVTQGAANTGAATMIQMLT